MANGKQSADLQPDHFPMQDQFYQQGYQSLHRKGGMQYAPGCVIVEWQVEPGGHYQPTDEYRPYTEGDGRIHHKIDLTAARHLGKLRQSGFHPGAVLQQMQKTTYSNANPQPLMHGQAGEIEVKQQQETNIKDPIESPFEILFFHFFTR
jgi:hypothetical protein